MGEKKYSFTGATAWVASTKTLAFGFSFFLPLVLVRYLTQEEFGFYKQIFLFVNTALTILPFSVGLSAFYYFPRERENRTTITLNILIFHLIGSALTGLAIFLFPNLLARVFNNSEFSTIGTYISLIVFTWVTPSFIEFVAVANDDIDWAGYYIAATSLLKSIVFIAAATIYGTVQAIATAAVILGIIQLFFVTIYLGSRYRGFLRAFNRDVLVRQLGYALPYGLASMLYYLEYDSHHYFVSAEYGVATYAIYAIGCFQIPLTAILSESIGSVILPRISSLQKEEKHREVVHMTAMIFRKMAAINIPLYFFLLVCATEFITFLFTKQYLASVPIFMINLFFIPLTIIQSTYDPILRSYAEHRFYLLRIRAVLLTINLIALFFVTRYYGLIATITVVVLIHALERLIISIKAAKIIEITRSDLALYRPVFRMVISGVVATLVVMLLKFELAGGEPRLVLALGFICFILTYLASLYTLELIYPQEETLHAGRLNFLGW
jgi:O-antigen/teichoic acid export membrane protein